MKNYCSTGRLLKYVNVRQVGTGKNPASPLYSNTKKRENFLNEKKDKNNKKKTWL